MVDNNKVIVGLTAAVHPNMPGDDVGVYRKIVKQIELLKKEFDFDLVTVNDPIKSEDDGKKTRKYLEDNNVDFTLIFCPSLPYGRAILPLVKINSYIGVWAVPEPTKSGVLQLNSFCGLNMVGTIIANYFTEYDIPFKWFYDYPDTQLFKDRLRITICAMRAIKTLKNTRIGQVGDLADGFENMYVDERLLEKKFGTYIQTRHTVEDIVRRAKGYKDGEVNKTLEKINSEGKWDKDHVSAEEMNKMARVNMALIDFAKEYNYNALAISCWTKFQEIYDLAVCGAMSRINQAGIVAPCEADISSTVIMVVLKALNGKVPTINDMVSLDPDDNSINLWHCGVAAKDWANSCGISWDQHFNIGEYKGGEWHGKGVVADMTFKTGDVTIATLQNNFNNLFVLTGTVMENKEAYYGSSGWVNNLKIDGKNVDIVELLNTIMVNRVNHHYPTVYDNLYEELVEFANWKKVNIFKPVKYENYMQNPS